MNTESIGDILSLSRTCYRANASSKKKCIELVAQTIANEYPQIQANHIYDAMIERERLGSTGIGHGCALPHCRLANTEHPIGSLILLNEPIDFDSQDKEAVDIIFALVVPEDDNEEHLKLLAKIAEKFSDPAFREKLRHTTEKKALFQEAIGA